MRVFALTLLIAGCGGDSGTAGTDAGADTDGSVPGDPCGSLPAYDLNSLSCAQLATAFENTTDAADGCSTAADCEVYYPNCAEWNEVGCWYAANRCASDALQEFIDEAAGLVCADTQQCSGCGAAPDVECTAGKCVLVYASY